MSYDPFKPPVILTKDYILARVSPEEIFHKYLGIYPEFNTRYTNPKRTNDERPDCNFYIDSRGVTKFADYAGGYNWDCFNVVEFEYKVTFKEAMRIIAEDFGIIDGGTRVLDRNLDRTANPRKVKVGIRIKRRQWNKADLAWWGQYFITEQILAKFNVYPVSDVWLIDDDDESTLRKVYYYKASDPCYAYHFGGYEYKLYFPLRKYGRFIQTSGVVVQGLQQLPETGDALLTTKGYKDVMCISIFSEEFDLHSYAPSSETIVIGKDLFTNLYNRFDYHASLFDFDRTGIRLARKYEATYHIPPLFFGASYKKSLFVKIPDTIKDFADHMKYKGIERTRDLIKQVYDKYRC